MQLPHFTLEETKIAVVILQALSENHSSTSRSYINADKVNRMLGIDEIDSNSWKKGIQAINDVFVKLELYDAIVVVRGPLGEGGTLHISSNTLGHNGEKILQQMIKKLNDMGAS